MESIKKARKICRITQAELADSLGIDQANYCNIENGKLILNTVPTIKNKAIEFLLPELDFIIALKSEELAEIKKLRESLYSEC